MQTPSGSTSTPAGWRYARPAIALHWMLALLIAGLLGVGWYMMAIEDEPGSGWYFGMHKSFGIVALVLVVVRLLWRAGHAPAALPPAMPAWQRKAAVLTHWLLYACMLLMPALGFIGASYSKRGVAFFGWKLPAWLVPDHDTAEQYFDLHGTLAWVLVALVVLHAAAAIKHLVKDKDGVFQRMWF
jgi:cytochrome b561